MKKFFLFVFLFAFFASAFFALVVSPALAVTKTSGDLELTADDPLFPVSIIWYPGLKETKSFVVKNIGSKTHTLYVKAVNTSQTGNLGDVFTVKISSNGTDSYGSGDNKTMTDFFNDGQITLVDIGGGNSVTVAMAIKMLTSAGNEYQGQEAKFDLEIGFVGEEEEAVVVSGVGVGAPGPAGPPVCTATTPTNVPVLSVVSIGTNYVTLAWTTVSPVTHYLIAYGLSSGDYIYGNPNVGNVTAYTISGLSGGTTYFFVVRGVNDCAPGPYSNEVRVTPLGPFLPGPPPGFFPGVRGVTAPEGELGEAGATEAGEIAGVQAKPICWWWLILSLAEFLILSVYYWLLARQKDVKRYWWLVAPGLAVLAYFFDQKIAHLYFTPSRFCSWMWLWSLLAAGLPTGWYLYLKRK